MTIKIEEAIWVIDGVLDVSAADNKVAIDAAATAGFIGATAGTGVIRVDGTMTKTDGGDFVTLSAVAAAGEAGLGRLFLIMGA